MTLVDIGLWCQIGDAEAAGRAALFLDRDGVIVADTEYLGRTEDMRIMPGAAAAIARCNALAIPVVVVTNQSGIARGLYDWNDFHIVQTAIQSALASAGAHLDAVLACGYHGDGLDRLRVDNHHWRKPNPGMIFAAGNRMKLNLAHSWIMGDKARDLQAGLSAGLLGGTLIGTDEREQQEASKLSDARFEVQTASTLSDAIGKLLEQRRLQQ